MPDYPPVILERDISASVERVYAAWTTPEYLQQWFHSSARMKVLQTDLDLRQGGAYRIHLNNGEEDFIVFGRYEIVDPPHRLEFTWNWQDGEIEPGETLVSVELSPIGERTRLRLTQTRFSSEISAQAHDAGWIGVLASLASFFEPETQS